MRTFYKNVVPCVLLVAIALGVAAIWGWVQFGSVRSALLYTGGVRVLADPNTGSVGVLIPKARASAKFQVVNLSDRAITIWGSKSSCTCTVVDDLPKSIPSRGREEIEISYRAGDLPREIRQTVVLLTDALSSPQLPLIITGRVVDEADGKGVRGQ